MRGQRAVFMESIFPLQLGFKLVKTVIMEKLIGDNGRVSVDYDWTVLEHTAEKLKSFPDMATASTGPTLNYFQ